MNVLKKILKNDLVLSVILFGELLVVVGAYFGVNPVESSAVSSEIRGTNLHIFLLLTATPASFLGVVTTNMIYPHSGYVIAASTLIIQAILYGLIGALLALFIKRKIFSIMILFITSIGSGYFLFYILTIIMPKFINSWNTSYELRYLVVTLIILFSSVYMLISTSRKIIGMECSHFPRHFFSRLTTHFQNFIKCITFK